MKFVHIGFVGILSLMLIAIFWVLISYATRTPEKTEKIVNDRFITIKIDGQEYLWGQFNNGNILVPKTPKCSCDTIK